jgi:GDPmannose 4,6-dehydratase
MAFNELGISLTFSGHGEAEHAVVASCSNSDYQVPIGQIVVAVDPKYYRPTEVDLLIGDSSKAKLELGWTCEYDLQSLVKEMILEDVRRVKAGTKI